MFEAVVSIVERELFGEQVRMLSQARTAMQSVRPGLGVADFLREMSDAMVEAMAVDSVDVLLAGQEAPLLEPHTVVPRGATCVRCGSSAGTSSSSATRPGASRSTRSPRPR